jgi:hypothetical protein
MADSIGEGLGRCKCSASRDWAVLFMLRGKIKSTQSALQSNDNKKIIILFNVRLVSADFDSNV